MKSSVPATIPRQKMRRFFLHPKTTRRNNIRRLIFLKHLLELRCFQEICNQVYCQNRDVSECRNYQPTRQWQQYKQRYYNKLREEQYRRKHPSDNRMAQAPPNVYVINPWTKNLPFRRPPPPEKINEKHSRPSDLTTQNTENAMYLQSSPQAGESRREEGRLVGDELNYIDIEDTQKGDDNFSQTAGVGVGATTYPNRLKPSTNRTPQYEVKEIVDEEPVLKENDIDGEKDNNERKKPTVEKYNNERKKPTAENDNNETKKPTIEKDNNERGKPTVEKDSNTDRKKPIEKDNNTNKKKPRVPPEQPKTTPDTKKPRVPPEQPKTTPDTKKPRVPPEQPKTTPDTKKPENNWKQVQQQTPKPKVSSDSPILTTIKNFLNHKFREFADEKPSQVRKDQGKHLKPPPEGSFHNRGPKIVPEIPPEQNFGGRTVEKTSSKSPETTQQKTTASTEQFLDDLEIPLHTEVEFEEVQQSTTAKKVLKPSKSPDLSTKTQQKTTATTNGLFTEPFDFPNDLDFLSNPDQNILEEVPENVDDLNDGSGVEKTVSILQELTDAEERSTAPVTFPKMETTVTTPDSKESSTTKTDQPKPTDSWTFPEDSDTPTATVNMVKTVEYYSEATVNQADLTTPDFQEFSDHPLLFDLFSKAQPDLSKEADAAEKNSRKMNFWDDSEKRRSDILITENADYFDYENNISAGDYLERLKQNGSLLSVDLDGNLTSEAIIRLIPIVVTDLREGKISSEDVPILSEAFGKYWPTVQALSNNTNLDMLSLMKIKTREDLEQLLQSFLPETTTSTTTGNTAADLNKNYYYDLFEYMDNYKDMYKDFGIITDKTKRFANSGNMADTLNGQVNI